MLLIFMRRPSSTKPNSNPNPNPNPKPYAKPYPYLILNLTHAPTTFLIISPFSRNYVIGKKGGEAVLDPLLLPLMDEAVRTEVLLEQAIRAGDWKEVARIGGSNENSRTSAFR